MNSDTRSDSVGTNIFNKVENGSEQIDPALVSERSRAFGIKASGTQQNRDQRNKKKSDRKQKQKSKRIHSESTLRCEYPVYQKLYPLQLKFK